MEENGFNYWSDTFILSWIKLIPCLKECVISGFVANFSQNAQSYWMLYSAKKWIIIAQI